jgi:hypothetical protein
MGYRSSVSLMAVFANAEQHDEVMSVYRMDRGVQTYRCEDNWRRVDMDGGIVVRIYEEDGVKWDENFDDVSAVMQLRDVMDMFWGNREFPYAFGIARVGDDYTDVQYDVQFEGDDGLDSIVYESMHIARHIEIDL